MPRHPPYALSCLTRLVCIGWIQTLAPSVALIWFRFYNSFRLRNMVYRNHLVLILGHRLFSEVIQYFRCTLGCLDIFIWYSMCSFQGTVSSLIKICLTFMVLRPCWLQLDLTVISGDKGIRTLDPLLARQVLSQLSYTPMDGVKWTRTIDLTLIRRAL